MDLSRTQCMMVLMVLMVLMELRERWRPVLDLYGRYELSNLIGVVYSLPLRTGDFCWVRVKIEQNPYFILYLGE